MWGTVGILYNKTMVSDPVDSWNILWDAKYTGEILMYDSMRDTIGITLKKLEPRYQHPQRSGYPRRAGSADRAETARSRVPDGRHQDGDDQRFNAALGVVYSGDAVYCIGENPDLGLRRAEGRQQRLV